MAAVLKCALWIMDCGHCCCGGS